MCCIRTRRLGMRRVFRVRRSDAYVCVDKIGIQGDDCYDSLGFGLCFDCKV